LLKLFTRAASFQGSPREIVLAFHVAYRLHLRLFPLASESLLSSRTSSFLEKISLERAEYIKALDDEIFALTHSSTEKVFTESNLSLQEHLSVPVITFINWSLSYGINALMNTGFDNQARDQFDGLHIEMIGANIMMDGLGIRPLSTEFDYSVSWHRITNELFREEYEQLNNNPAVL
ncbi:MAG: hypothetical protein P1U57_06355, partial [Oleibacter sp.]|nr:hypothetical protein [Thalassolituus sp.]